MDQVKEYLNLAIKYRFWIAVGIAALLPVAGYFAAAGSVDAEKKKLETEVESSYKAAQKYANDPRPVNDKYEPLVKAENAVIKSDIDTSWRKLYARQAPYLTWPSEVEDTIPVWARIHGRDKWPEDLDRFAVDEAIRAYVESYDPYIDQVYSVFKPFDPETGKGIVSAPMRDALLQVPKYEIGELPSLGKIWTTQEKLWIQRTVLEVIAAVNEKAGATEWAAAPIKQIVDLDVASDTALDQKSVSEGVTLTEAPDILPPGAAAAEPAAAAPAGDVGGGKLGGGVMGGGAAGAGASQVVKYVTNTVNDEQLSIAPFFVSVYCRQEAIPNLLVEFQNSPMDIQVLEVEVAKPAPFSVKKPKKGEYPSGGGMGMMSGRGGRGGMLGTGYGDSMVSLMRNAMGPGAGGYGNSPGGDMTAMMKSMGSSGGYSASTMRNMGGGGMGSTPEVEKRKGVDVRSKTQADIKAKADARDKAKNSEATEEEPPPSKISDPYYDVVEVRVYGQARFYKAPPVEEKPETAAGEPVPAADATAPAAEVPATDGATSDPANDAAAKPATDEAVTPDAAAPKADAAAETPATDAPKDESKPADAAKGEATPADAPKDETKPADPPKDETKPAEAPAGEQKSDDAPKTGADSAEKSN